MCAGKYEYHEGKVVLERTAWRVRFNISLSRSERNECLMTGFERVIDGNRKFREEITEWSPTNSKIKLLTVFFGGVVRSKVFRILLFERTSKVKFII